MISKHSLLIGTFSFLMGVLVMKSSAEIPCTNPDKEGTILQLTLSASSTSSVRAQFCYRGDCSLIANQMNIVEKARWSCK